MPICRIANRRILLPSLLRTDRLKFSLRGGELRSQFDRPARHMCVCGGGLYERPFCTHCACPLQVEWPTELGSKPPHARRKLLCTCCVLVVCVAVCMSDLFVSTALVLSKSSGLLNLARSRRRWLILGLGSVAARSCPLGSKGASPRSMSSLPQLLPC